jgi:hypothetical protein
MIIVRVLMDYIQLHFIAFTHVHLSWDPTLARLLNNLRCDRTDSASTMPLPIPRITALFSQQSHQTSIVLQDCGQFTYTFRFRLASLNAAQASLLSDLALPAAYYPAKASIPLQLHPAGRQASNTAAKQADST